MKLYAVKPASRSALRVTTTRRGTPVNKVWIAVMTVGPFILFALVTLIVGLLKHA